MGRRLSPLALLLVPALASCSDPTCAEKAICPADLADDAGVALAAPHDGAAGPSSDAPPPPTCAGPEDCTNGVDDDCDGHTDCDDPACRPAFGCVAEPPAGWSGPGALSSATGAPASPPAACAPPLASDAFDGVADPDAPPAACGCTCGSPTQAACTTTASYFYDSSCGNACSTSTLSPTCSPTCSGAQTMKVTTALSAPGSCAPTATKSVAPLAWKTAARVCAAPLGAGCGAASVCVASAATCIWHPGEVDCAAPYVVRHVYYAGAADTRGCGACDCDVPHGVQCSAVTASVYGDPCTGSVAGFAPGSGACVPAPSGARGATAPASVASGGSCGPKSAGPVGSVTPQGATTVCCSS